MGLESDAAAPPPLDLQREFWNEWNRTYRSGDLDEFMRRQRDAAIAAARRVALEDGRILDVGCGTGWLGNSLLPFGHVWGTDLSTDAIARGRRMHPDATLLCGDFITLDLPGLFDFVVCADALAHMRDQARCVDRIAELLRPGGTFVLMTQNPVVWRRRSRAKPLGHGQHQVWPSLAECRALLANNFAIDEITSLDPGGDRGMLWWVENRYVRGVMGRVLGHERWRNLLERMRLGRELVIVARRKRPAA